MLCLLQQVKFCKILSVYLTILKYELLYRFDTYYLIHIRKNVLYIYKKINLKPRHLSLFYDIDVFSADQRVIHLMSKMIKIKGVK